MIKHDLVTVFLVKILFMIGLKKLKKSVQEKKLLQFCGQQLGLVGNATF